MHDELKYVSLVTTYEVDDSFDSDKFIKLRLRVCHDGENPNGSSFAIEDMNKAEDSIKNIPLLARVVWDEDGNPQFGSHDMHIEEDKLNEGEYRLIYDEQPLGVIPETNNYEISEYNGKNYVFTDCFVWRDYANYGEDIIKRDNNVKLSMEILVDSYKYDSKTKVYSITDYRYKGITLLGNNLGTGMLDALATTESFSDTTKQKLFVLMSDLKEEINKNQSSHFSEVDINKTKKNGEEEKKPLNEKLELLAKYELTVDTIDFNIDEFSLEEIEAKLKEKYEQTDDTNSDLKVSFSATYNQKREALRNALDAIYVKDEDGDIVESTYYYVMDFSDEYVFVEKDYWDEEGNFEETHGRFAYTFNEEDLTASISGEWEEMYLMWLTADEKQALDAERTNYASIKSEFDTYKTEYCTPETEVEELRTFQNDRLTEDRQIAEDELFENFDTKLAENDEYKSLKEKSKEFSIDELKKECLLILGGVNANFSVKDTKKKSSIKFAVDAIDPDDKSDEYGGLFVKYGKKEYLNN